MKRTVSILALVLVGSIGLPADAQAAFGIDDFDVTFTEADGDPAARAGSHPFAMTTSLKANSDGEETEGRLEELLVDLPPGLVADTTASPSCAEEDFLDPEGDCSLSTVVGTSSSSFLEPGHSETALVYKLVPPEGVLLRLGFRVADAASVVVDVELSPDSPYNPIAVAGDWPETVDVFATEVQLWGVPAAPAHDAQRGGSVNVPSSPFLTLPTSCDGPLETFYEALSWEGESVTGSVLTHDGGGLLSMTDCLSLPFEPLVDAQPTVKEAKSPTGLDLSLDFYDDGLVSPVGFAESTVREIALALPGEMTAGSALSSAVGACAEQDFAEESLDAGPAEGCPDAASVGTVEVESPLVAGPVEGDVYKAVPFVNAAEDSPMALYLVLRSAGLGILVKQAVGIEADPETGQLIVLAEDLPQLPFGKLRLHLGQSAGGPLIAPPLCGSYETSAQLVPWSDDGSPILTTSSFEIVSGPGGEPCPVEGGESAPEQKAGCAGCASPAGSPGAVPPGVVRPATARHKPHCPKGRRRVHRNGKARCVQRAHGKRRGSNRRRTAADR